MTLAPTYSTSTRIQTSNGTAWPYSKFNHTVRRYKTMDNQLPVYHLCNESDIRNHSRQVHYSSSVKRGGIEMVWGVSIWRMDHKLSPRAALVVDAPREMVNGHPLTDRMWSFTWILRISVFTITQNSCGWWINQFDFRFAWNITGSTVIRTQSGAWPIYPRQSRYPCLMLPFYPNNLSQLLLMVTPVVVLTNSGGCIAKLNTLVLPEAAAPPGQLNRRSPADSII